MWPTGPARVCEANFGLRMRFQSTFMLPQTKIWEDRTNRSDSTQLPSAFPREALFKGASTLFGPRIVENCFQVNALGS
jgi:hypothetical protein